MGTLKKVSKRELEKERKQKEQKREAQRELTKAMTEVSSQKDSAISFSKKCEDMAYESARKGMPKSITQNYLRTAARMKQFGMKLEIFLQNIQLAVMQSIALEDIANLAKVASACSKFFEGKFDFSGIGAELTDVMGHVDEAMNDFFNQMDSLENTDGSNSKYSVSKLFGENAPNEEVDKIFKEMEKELEFRMGKDLDLVNPASASEQVGNPNEADHNAGQLRALFDDIKKDGQ